MDYESLWIVKLIIGFIFGIILTFNRYDTGLWISAIETIIILTIIVTAVILLVGRNKNESLLPQIFKNFFMNLWQLVVGVLFGMCFTSFIGALF